MEPRELAELVKEHLQVSDWAAEVARVRETRFGFGDSDFFVETEGEGTFLFSVVKVSE